MLSRNVTLLLLKAIIALATGFPLAILSCTEPVAGENELLTMLPFASRKYNIFVLILLWLKKCELSIWNLATDTNWLPPHPTKLK